MKRKPEPPIVIRSDRDREAMSVSELERLRQDIDALIKAGEWRSMRALAVFVKMAQGRAR